MDNENYIKRARDLPDRFLAINVSFAKRKPPNTEIARWKRAMRVLFEGTIRPEGPCYRIPDLCRWLMGTCVLIYIERASRRC